MQAHNGAVTHLHRRDKLAELLPSLREQLEAQRTFRAEQLADLIAHAEPDESQERRQVDAALADAARWALHETEAALARIDEGHYGTCEDCAGPIALERLEVIPHARFCPACQQKQQADGSATAQH
ncbi:MAG: hypothetical protein GEV10_05440 [Streptosporangiales bacterium]|nr:hypothetical protein [Streptosporangiales bacterium]